jgi:hypothetical protein
MTNSEFQETIHKACMAAFEAGVKEGRRLEAEAFWKAIDLNSTFNEIGDFVYLNDLKDGLEEIQNVKVS